MARVCHLTSVHWPYDIRIFEKECRSLAAYGHEVVVVAAGAEDGLREGVRFVSVGSPRSRSRRMTATAREVVARALEQQADLYHLHDPELLLWCAPLTRTGRPVVYDMHEDLPRQIEEKEWIPTPLRKPLSWLAAKAERTLLRAKPVVVAEEAYAANRPWLGNHCVVLNYPRLDWLNRIVARNLNDARPWIGYLGTVTRDRGCLRVIEALCHEELQDRGVAFDCIGPVSAELAAEMREFASKRGFAGLEIPGRLAPREAWQRLMRCRVGLAVLEPLPNYVESFPTKLFEYMALGLPVVVSDFPLYRNIVAKHRCGVAVDPCDSTAIARAIAGILEDPEAAARMGDAGKAAVAGYSWESEQKKLVGFYDELL